MLLADKRDAIHLKGTKSYKLCSMELLTISSILSSMVSY
jgi:hypothetical protein